MGASEMEDTAAGRAADLLAEDIALRNKAHARETCALGSTARLSVADGLTCRPFRPVFFKEFVDIAHESQNGHYH